MMAQKLRKQKKNLKWLYWLILLVLLIAAGALTFVVWKMNLGGEREQEDTTIEESEVQTAESNEETETNTESTNENAVPPSKVKQYEGEGANSSEVLTGVVTQTSLANGNLTIWTNIDQYLSNGSCELALMENGRKVYGETVNIVADVATSYCENLSVPVAAVGNGNYEIIINLNSGGKTGVINGEATI